MNKKLFFFIFYPSMISYSDQCLDMIYDQYYENTIKNTDDWKTLPISGLLSKYVNYLLLFEYERHN